MIGSTAKSHGSFGRLIRYQMDEEKCPALETHHLYGQTKQELIEEMETTVAKYNRQHPKGKDVTTPTYHLSISWDEEDNPSRDEMLQIGREFLEHMSLSDHQAIVAIHSDKFYNHIHIVANRVHPDGGRLWQEYQWGEGRKVEKTHHQRVEEFLRAAELKHGWRQVPGRHAGPHERSFDGKRPTQSEYHRARRAVEAARALDIDKEYMLPVKARARAVRHELFQAESFAEFDQVLAEKGLYIDVAGQGGVIKSGPGFQVKLSDVSRQLSAPKLEEKFGQLLKNYIGERNAGIDIEQSKADLESYSELWRAALYGKITDIASNERQARAGKLFQVEAYDDEFKNFQRNMEQALTDGFENPKEAYHLLMQHLQRGGLDGAAAVMADHPEGLGEVKSEAATVRASEHIRELQQMQARYSDYITGLSPAERKAKIEELESEIGALDKFRAGIPNVPTSALRSHEAGRAIDGSVRQVVGLAQAAEIAARNPAAGAMAGGQQAFGQALGKMDSEAGQVVSKGIGESIKTVQLAAELIANPNVGGLKMTAHFIKGAVQTAARQGHVIGISH
jgi:hypothetical protein